MQIASTATVPVLTDPSVAIEGIVLGWHVLTSLLARPELALVLPAVGGMFDLGSKGEEDDPAGDEASTGDDAGFADDGDGMDEMDDWGDLDGGNDDWGEDAGGDQLGELEDKVSDLETEVSGLSSSMETVKEENRQLAETVDDADETIRKLLDVYEIVTRGINPFVDDAEAMAGADGSFGLFGDQASEEPIDPDIADADAESFFDDDFDDFDEDATDPEAEDEPEVETEYEGGDEDEGGSGASFDDLKAEYDADDGSWEDVVDEDEANDDEIAADDGAEEADEAALDDEETAEELLADADEQEAEAWGDELGLDEELAPEPEPDVVVDEGTPEPTADPEPTFDPEPEPTPQANGNGHHAENGHAADGRPYLTRVPNGYATEMVLLDWARYLVESGDTAGAVDAFRHYERLGWISERVRRRLATLATELCDAPPATAPVDLGPAHHRRSLEYVSRLAGRPVTGGLLREAGDSVTGGL